MKFANLPEPYSLKGMPLPFYLAMEEWLARRASGEWFFFWQVNPTVIFGRNQDCHSEVNTSYCRREGIEFFRRKSGGGCVYADLNNLMFSYICDSTEVATTFTSFTGRVAELLRKMGIAEAHTTGRNDILIGERKVSGYAFYHIHNGIAHDGSPSTRAIVHGTMLHSIDAERMTNALTPAAEKLRAKGVVSVQSRVTSISEHSPLSLEEFKTFVRTNLCNEEATLSPEDVAEIQEIAREYFTEEWILGRHAPQSGSAVKCRIEGVGEICISLNAADGKILTTNISGDFFLLAPLSSLTEALSEIPATPQAIEERIRTLDIPSIISGLSPQTLSSLMLQALEKQ